MEHGTTGTIPIVSPVAGLLVERGSVKSLAKPGGNVTGLTTQIGLFKLYQLFKEAAPKVTRVVYLYDPGSQLSLNTVERLTSQAKAANLGLQLVALRDPNNIELALGEFKNCRGPKRARRARTSGPCACAPPFRWSPSWVSLFLQA